MGQDRIVPGALLGSDARAAEPRASQRPLWEHRKHLCTEQVWSELDTPHVLTVSPISGPGEGPRCP